MLLRRIAFLVMVALLFWGCSSSKKGHLSSGEYAELSDEDLALLEQKRWQDGSSIPSAVEDGVFKDIHFDYDSASLPPEVHEELRRNAEYLLADPDLMVEIEGHCDKRGTNEYNLALGSERARVISDMLASYGVSSSRLTTVSYGEEIPLDPSDSEDAYARNRRVHFALYRLREQ